MFKIEKYLEGLTGRTSRLLSPYAAVTMGKQRRPRRNQAACKGRQSQ
jgi:hypothetical protein